jgi:hypothetical protein
MKHIIELAAPENVPLSLAEQRLNLRIKLQLNRRLLAHKFSDAQLQTHFPRSMLVRFLTQPSMLHVFKKLAFTAVGMKTFKSLHYGFSLWQFFRNNLAPKNPT